MPSFTLQRLTAAGLAALFTVVTFATATLSAPAHDPVLARQATPEATYSCATADAPSTPMAMGEMDHDNMGDMGMGEMAEFDQVYIDMMLPHHASVIAMSEAALPVLTDERLIEIAETIIETQDAEIAELRSLREQFYGSPDPAPMDDAMMAMMDEMMPEAHAIMMSDPNMMDSNALVAQFCASDNPDVAFIDLTIPHHQSAILASEAALEQAVNPEMQEFAEGVIADQQAEIDMLNDIRVDLTGEAAPMATPDATEDGHEGH